MLEPVFDVTSAVAVLNQTLEYAYPTITVVGELANFKVAKGKWVYADIKDDNSKLRMFGTVFNLPAPLEEGMKIEVIAQPRINPIYGFSLNYISIKPVGEGSIKKAADLLKLKLEKEGLFDESRKRHIPRAPEKIGLITSVESAAYVDFIKVLNARWQGVEVHVQNTQVQGDQAVEGLVQAVRYYNQMSSPPDVLVITRGGGSADDLSAFSVEAVVREVASSRIPTLVAVGHEVDISLAELAADVRASTPSNAAEILFPDKLDEKRHLTNMSAQLDDLIKYKIEDKSTNLKEILVRLDHGLESKLELKQQQLKQFEILLNSVNPENTLKRGYALVSSKGKLVKSIKQLKPGSDALITMYDGKVKTKVKGV